MRYTLLCCIVLLTPLSAAQAATDGADHDQMIRNAIAAFDQGDFPGAITLLKQVVDADPKNGFAGYELAYSYQASGDLKNCIKVAKSALRKIRKDKEQAGMVSELSMILASCYSQSGNSKKALKVFEKGLKNDPDNYGLNFNIAITLSRAGETDAAIDHLAAAIAADPRHPSPYYVLGTLYGERSEAAQALLSLTLFLQYEYNTERSTDAARYIIDLMFSGVETDVDTGSINIFMDPEQELGGQPFRVLDVMLKLSAAASLSDGEIKEPVAETLGTALKAFIAFSAGFEFDAADEESVTGSVLLPEIEAIQDAGIGEVFSYFILSQAGVPGAVEWLDEHSNDTDTMVAYLQGMQMNRMDSQAE